MIWTTAKSTDVRRPQSARPSRENGSWLAVGRAVLSAACVAMTGSYAVAGWRDTRRAASSAGARSA